MSDGVAPSKGAWTPGPWRIISEALGHRDLGIAGANGDLVLVTAGIGRNSADHANALLISKSPQMAALLRRVTKVNSAHYVADELAVIVAEAERLLTDLEVKP